MGRSCTVGRTKTNGGIAEKHRKNNTVEKIILKFLKVPQNYENYFEF